MDLRVGGGDMEMGESPALPSRHQQQQSQSLSAGTSFPVIAPHGGEVGGTQLSLPSLKSILPMETLPSRHGHEMIMTSQQQQGNVSHQCQRTLPVPSTTITATPTRTPATSKPFSLFSIASLLDTSAAPSPSPTPHQQILLTTATPTTLLTLDTISSLTREQISSARAQLVKEIEGLNEIITQKAGLVLGLERAERLLALRDAE